jgi:hypothetical protein
MNPEPKVTLLSWTHLPLETVYSVWQASKNVAPLVPPDEVKRTVPAKEVEDLFRAVIRQHIPIGEHINFVFMMEHVSVSWREQAVRHRIGVQASPERVGADHVFDMIPNLAESSWWSQSMRIQDMGLFASNGEYRLPRTVVEAGADAVAMYERTMQVIEGTYNTLVHKHNVPMEDARELMPLGAQHRISWSLNISALQHILAKRGCWILQLGIWGPVIMGMVQELVQKVHPIFAELVTPPCLDGDDYKGCVYQEEVRRRYTGDDKLPPCPLHLYHEKDRKVADYIIGNDFYGLTPADLAPDELAMLDSVPRLDEMMRRAEDYKAFWNRDPFTGVRLPVVP